MRIKQGSEPLDIYGLVLCHFSAYRLGQPQEDTDGHKECNCIIGESKQRQNVGDEIDRENAVQKSAQENAFGFEWSLAMEECLECDANFLREGEFHVSILH